MYNNETIKRNEKKSKIYKVKIINNLTLHLVSYNRIHIIINETVECTYVFKEFHFISLNR